jgi:hypothetical protein
MIKIWNVNDRRFARYGNVIKDIDCSDLLEVLKQTPCPPDVEYVASLDKLEETKAARELGEIFFGGIPVEVGYCNGHNRSLNALEYHRNSELIIAATDAILLLGDIHDISDTYTYDTSLAEAFLLPAGTAAELYSTTLHYAPCSAGPGGFRTAIILPRGTNASLKHKPEAKGEAALLFAVNKWLIAHEEAGIEGAHAGLIGENIHL